MFRQARDQVLRLVPGHPLLRSGGPWEETVAQLSGPAVKMFLDAEHVVQEIKVRGF